jgi:hypothetical protein
MPLIDRKIIGLEEVVSEGESQRGIAGGCHHFVDPVQAGGFEHVVEAGDVVQEYFWSVVPIGMGDRRQMNNRLAAFDGADRLPEVSHVGPPDVEAVSRSDLADMREGGVNYYGLVAVVRQFVHHESTDVSRSTGYGNTHRSTFRGLVPETQYPSRLQNPGSVAGSIPNRGQ